MSETFTPFSSNSAVNSNVSGVCMMFGGGGHEKAAGAVIQGDIEQVKQKIMKELKKVLK